MKAQQPNDEQVNEFVKMLKSFSTAMLATHNLDGQMHARPMVVADVDDNHALWLISDAHSGKVDEVSHDARASLTLQKDATFASITGTAEVVRDEQKVQQLWSEPWRVWFPKGPTDPSIVLLKVQPELGEYWDNSGLSKAKYLYKAAKAYIKGERPEMDQQLHGRVDLTAPQQ